MQVHGLQIDNLKAQVAPGISPALFEDVKGLVIRGSPVLDDLKSEGQR
jgi:hypothetical protein